MISIHAPRVGSDNRGQHSLQAYKHFNPRSPCGERLCRGNKFTQTLNISIHAPRVGSDAEEIAEALNYKVFQSTLPVWGATGIKSASADRSPISIHAPRVGSDDLQAFLGDGFQDFNPRSPCGERLVPFWINGLLPNFNPRSPCGERRMRTSPNGRWSIFQSTLPVWGATIIVSPFQGERIISIHAPRVGSDPEERFCPWYWFYFNPRSPGGERLCGWQV